MTRILAFFAALLLLGAPTAGMAEPSDELAALRQQDIRLASTVEQIGAANVEMCRESMPLTGMVLHTRDQYAQPQAAWFANGDVAVLALVPDGPAAEAGLRENDALAAIDNVLLGALEKQDGYPFRDTVFDRIATAQAGEIALDVMRDGQMRAHVVAAPQGCRILAEILTSNDIRALSDGRVLQITYGLAARLDDEQLAVVVAHELAHAVLLHRRRLEDAGVKKGLLGEFGRNRRLGQQVEVEADRLSVHLLANAGFDPVIAVAFWNSEAGEIIDGGILRSRVYPSRARRAEILAEEIAAYLNPIPAKSWPDHLIALRDTVLGD